MQVAYRLNSGGVIPSVGWLDGFIGCFKPMWLMIGKGKPQEQEKGKVNVKFNIIRKRNV